MNPQPASTPPAIAHELRVVSGPQQGAVLPLLPGRSYRVGTGLGADIVLRVAAGCASGSATISLGTEGLLLQALAGEVVADGEPLAVGESRLLRGSTPWQLAGTSLALASSPAASDDASDDAPHTAPNADAASPRAAGSHAAGAAMAQPAQVAAAVPARLRGWVRRLVTGGAAVVAASLSLWALAMAIAPTAPQPQALAQRAQATLHAAGMTAVTVTLANGQGELVVEGYLDTHAQRTRAESLLAAQGLKPRFAVWINENLAQAVQDVYRVQGVSAQVQPLGPGHVRVSTALANASGLPAVEKIVRRDVQGLNQLETRNAPPPGVPSPVPALDDPGKRLASVVAGPEPYVATQDGTRYFIGALLPTGHRILAIRDGHVELEREGQNTALVF